MKQVLFAIALLGTTAMTAQAAEIIWQGDVFVKSVVGSCAGAGITSGTFFRGVFKPKGEGTNGPDTKLSLIGQRNAQRYLFANSAYGNKPSVAATFITSTANVVELNSNFSQAKATPANPTANTQTIVLEGKITNFAAIGGCTATIVGSLGLRVD
jgi:hypothetical protein